MRFYKLISLFLLISLTQEAMGQEEWLFGRWVNQGYNYNLECGISIDTVTKDTIFESLKYGYRKIKSEDGVILSYGRIFGGMGTDCGCEAIPHGYWINRNRDNTVREEGEYYCNQKMGIWCFYENGTISKIESYSKAYPNYIKRNNRLTYRSGPYYQFHANGTMKVEGFYRIIEEYSNTDTVFIFNSDTYEQEIKIEHGDYWVPRSVKYGVWKYYNDSGNLIKEETWEIEMDNDKIRYPEVHLIELNK
jgi:hypothetical protein